jgi:hypothetical protein
MGIFFLDYAVLLLVLLIVVYKVLKVPKGHTLTEKNKD